MKRMKKTNGFTLLEVLIAIALSLLLLSAIYAALNLSQKFSVAGQAATERSQIAREILRRIASDVRTVAKNHEGSVSGRSQPTNAIRLTRANSATNRSTAGTISSEIGQSPFEMSSPNIQDAVFIGERNSILVRIGSSSRHHVPATQREVKGGSINRAQPKLIAFVLSDGRSSSLPDQMRQALNPAEFNAVALAGKGLVRIELTLPPRNRNVPTSEIRFSSVQIDVLAEEVTNLQFRYFNGKTWLDRFDFNRESAIPRSVEIRIGVAHGQEQNDASHRSSSASDGFHLVIDIPTSDGSEPDRRVKTQREFDRS